LRGYLSPSLLFSLKTLENNKENLLKNEWDLGKGATKQIPLTAEPVRTFKENQPGKLIN
jgi:hypothetical protein